MQPFAVGYPDSPSPVLQDVSRNAYELDDEPDREPVYIEMNPEEFVPPNKLYYASKDLLSHRPDLHAKKVNDLWNMCTCVCVCVCVCVMVGGRGGSMCVCVCVYGPRRTSVTRDHASDLTLE